MHRKNIPVFNHEPKNRIFYYNEFSLALSLIFFWYWARRHRRCHTCTNTHTHTPYIHLLFAIQRQQQSPSIYWTISIHIINIDSQLL